MALTPIFIGVLDGVHGRARVAIVLDHADLTPPVLTPPVQFLFFLFRGAAGVAVAVGVVLLHPTDGYSVVYGSPDSLTNPFFPSNLPSKVDVRVREQLSQPRLSFC